MLGVRDFADMINSTNWDPLFYSTLDQFETTSGTYTIVADASPLSQVALSINYYDDYYLSLKNIDLGTS